MSRKFTPQNIKNSGSAFPLDAPKRDPQAISIPLSKIKKSSNPRKDLGELGELKDSIAKDGLLYPLLVRKTSDEFELLGGYRRLECLKQLEYLEASCRVIDTNQPELIKLIDNLLRQQLDPESEALGVKQLLPLFEGNQSALARALSKSPTYVSRMVKVASLIESGLCAGAKVPLSKSAIMELADSPDPLAVLSASEDGRKDSIRKARGKAIKSDEIASQDSEPSELKSRMLFHHDDHGWRLEIVWRNRTATEDLRSDVEARLASILEGIAVRSLMKPSSANDP